MSPERRAVLVATAIALLSGLIWMLVVNTRTRTAFESMDSGLESVIEDLQERIADYQARDPRSAEEEVELQDLFQRLAKFRELEQRQSQGVPPVVLGMTFATGAFLAFAAAWLSAQALLRWCRRSGVLTGGPGEAAVAAGELPEVFR